MAKSIPLTQQDYIDLRDANISGQGGTPQPFYNTLVRVEGSNNTGYAEMFGILTGVTWNRDQDQKVYQVIVYMEGQQHTSFNAKKSAVWCYPVVK